MSLTKQAKTLSKHQVSLTAALLNQTRYPIRNQVIFLLSVKAGLRAKAKGFVLLPKRWIVERTLGCLGRCRRLAKDFENLSRSHAAFVILAMIRLMLRRIVRLQPAS